MTQLQHLLFDNDGTVVDSEFLAVQSMLELLSPHGITLTEHQYAARFPGLLTRDIVAILQEEYAIKLPETFVDDVRNHHVDLFDKELRAIKGMPSVFKNVKLPKSMVSNGSVAHVVRCLRRVRLHAALKGGHIFSAEHVERPKPYPDIYQFALKTLGLPPEAVLVIEDSPTGVTAAHEAGLTVVGFLGARHSWPSQGEDLRARGATYIAADARELSELLREFGAL